MDRNVRLSKLSTTKALTWRYKNDEGKIFGPFTSEQMNAWVQGGYFPATLMVSSSDKLHARSSFRL